MKIVNRSQRYPLVFEAHNGVRLGCTKHAIKRAQQRGIDLHERFSALKGKPISVYKSAGVIAQWKPYQRFVVIISVF